MKKLQIATLLILSVLTTLPAHAYLDPGTGSMLLQMLIAGIVGALFTLKMYWYKTKRFVLRMVGKEFESATLETYEKARMVNDSSNGNGYVEQSVHQDEDSTRDKG